MPNHPANLETLDLDPTSQFYYWHIPKTAGTTFSYGVLAQCFSEEETCPASNYQQLFEMHQPDLRRYRLFRGHFFHFFHRLLPRKPLYLTLLRDPVSREISSYEYVCSSAEHYMHEHVLSQGSFLRYLRNPFTFRPNPLVREIAADMDPLEVAGVALLNGGYPEIDKTIIEDVFHSPASRSHLEIAKQRISEMAFVGLQERFDDSIRLLAGTFGWKTTGNLEPLNKSSYRFVRPSEMSQSEIDLAHEMLSLDLELYEYAKGLFNQRLQALDDRTRTDGPNEGHSAVPNRTLASLAYDRVPASDKVVPLYRLQIPMALGPTLNISVPNRTLASLAYDRVPASDKVVPLYYLQIPMALGPTLGMSLLYQYVRPSRVCPAWGYEQLLKLPSKTLAHFSLFRGMFYYFLHKVLPSRPDYFTILRDPPQLAMSLYRYVCRSPAHFWHERATAPDGLADYLRNLYVSNWMVLLLVADLDPVKLASDEAEKSGRGLGIDRRLHEEISRMKATETDLEVAKQRLRDFAFVGLRERFPESLLLMRNTFQWDEPSYFQDLNLRPSPGIQLEDVPRELVSVLMERNDLDVKLYQYAAQLFQGRLERAGLAG